MKPIYKPKGAANVVDTLCSSAQMAAVTAVVMAAEMRRTLSDLCEAEKQDQHYPMDDLTDYDE